MLGSLIGGALSVGGAIFGGIKASKAASNVKKSLQQQQQLNRQWYDRVANEDATQRADAQRAITLMQERILKGNRDAAATAAVMGAGPEAAAAQKAVNTQALADATAQIAMSGAARKDAADAAYQQRDAQLQAQLNGNEMNKANAISQAIGGVGSAAVSLGTGIDDYLEERRGGALEL